MAERETSERGGERGQHEGAGGRPRTCSRRPRTRKRISGSKAESIGAPLLRGDRRARPRRRRRAVGRGRARERARPGRRARPRGRARVHRRADRRVPDLQHGGRLDDHRGRALRRAVADDAAPSPGPGSFGGIAPTGNPIELEGFDLLTVRDGLIQSNDAFTDSMTFARADRDDAAAGLHGRSSG